ncbi:DNA invertase Pin-like site-specific DNA recombinase [Ureibacillus xyleni]|uniref:DNA invertase Pin-like site-specific DNA recombinase n=1 Tax=Ureibacillus xyleni TaxID=614648 RepID=A0A285R910_9BACL|nr:recombinase family protein [Ureibacillus xyleni]SOB90551.1 DNA invertase Pin-like site-specific DNA recombinase [Ureibacillus xyleni]
MKGIRIAVGYARTSGIINPKSSIPTQMETIKKYCQKNNIILKHIFVDECKTGTKVEGRNQYQEMKKLIKTEQIDMVIVAFSDRLARDSYEFILTMNDMVEQGIEFVSVSENLTSHFMSPLQIVMMGLQVELENKQRNQRIIESSREKFRQGKFIYTKKPYGYDVDKNYYLIIKEDEAAIVRRIYEEFLKGKGTTLIARELNAEGLYNKEKEKPWSNVKVNNILEHKTYTGLIYHKEKDEDGNFLYIPVSDREHPAIVSVDMFEDVQRIRQKSSRKKKEVKNFHFLSGILMCPNCYSKMYGIAERGIYACYNKKTNLTRCPTVDKEKIESLVFEYLSEMDSVRQVTSQQKNQSNKEKEYKKIMSEKEQCEVKFAKALLSLETFEKNMEILNHQLKELQEGRDLLVYITDDDTYDAIIKKNDLKQLKERLNKEQLNFTFNEKMELIQLENHPAAK